MNLKTIAAGIALSVAPLCAIVPLAVRAAPFDAAAYAPIRTAFAALDAGDRGGFLASFASEATILDEISPFRFSGGDAAAAWFDRLAAVNRDNAITSERSRLEAARFGSIEGNTAYATVPTRIDYEQRGKPVVENGTWTFALQNVAGTWKISGAAWTPLATH